MTTTSSESTEQIHKTNIILFRRGARQGEPPSLGLVGGGGGLLQLGRLFLDLLLQPGRDRRRRRLRWCGRLLLLLSRSGRGWGLLVGVASGVGGAGDGGAEAVEEGPESGLHGDPDEREAAGDDHRRLQGVALALASSSLRHRCGASSRIDCC